MPFSLLLFLTISHVSPFLPLTETKINMLVSQNVEKFLKIMTLNLKILTQYLTILTRYLKEDLSK